MDSTFDSWMDRYSQEFPGDFKADEADAGTLILQKHKIMGFLWEAKLPFSGRLPEPGAGRRVDKCVRARLVKVTQPCFDVHQQGRGG
jgi:hypothetical protein